MYKERERERVTNFFSLFDVEYHNQTLPPMQIQRPCLI